jgi:formylglycine-generating enzyme
LGKQVSTGHHPVDPYEDEKKKNNRLVTLLTVVLIVITTAFIITIFLYPESEKKKVAKQFEPVTPEFFDSFANYQKNAQGTQVLGYDQLIKLGDSTFDGKKYTKAKEYYRGALLIKAEDYPRIRIAQIDSIIDAQKMESIKEGKVLVEGGAFKMGNDNGEKDEKPAHQVLVRSFYIDQYEVTVYHYRKFCDATGREMAREPKWGWNDEDPIVNISYNDAVDYANWCGKRLPSEAEWEYAARGGKKSKNYKYAGGDNLAEVGWYWANSKEKTHPVGLKKPNELNIYDMTGNVWEWTQDWFGEEYYAESPNLNPRGPATGVKKILRGASWYSLFEYCHLTFRSHGNPDYKFNHIGMRLVWDLDNDQKVEELRQKHRNHWNSTSSKQKAVAQK